MQYYGKFCANNYLQNYGGNQALFRFGKDGGANPRIAFQWRVLRRCKERIDDVKQQLGVSIPLSINSFIHLPIQESRHAEIGNGEDVQDLNARLTEGVECSLISLQLLSGTGQS